MKYLFRSLLRSSESIQNTGFTNKVGFFSASKKSYIKPTPFLGNTNKLSIINFKTLESLTHKRMFSTQNINLDEMVESYKKTADLQHRYFNQQLNRLIDEEKRVSEKIKELDGTINSYKKIISSYADSYVKNITDEGERISKKNKEIVESFNSIKEEVDFLYGHQKKLTIALILSAVFLVVLFRVYYDNVKKTSDDFSKEIEDMNKNIIYLNVLNGVTRYLNNFISYATNRKRELDESWFWFKEDREETKVLIDFIRLCENLRKDDIEFSDEITKLYEELTVKKNEYKASPHSDKLYSEINAIRDKINLEKNLFEKFNSLFEESKNIIELNKIQKLDKSLVSQLLTLMKKVEKDIEDLKKSAILPKNLPNFLKNQEDQEKCLQKPELQHVEPKEEDASVKNAVNGLRLK